jgi:hypothetical protein
LRQTLECHSHIVDAAHQGIADPHAIAPRPGKTPFVTHSKAFPKPSSNGWLEHAEDLNVVDAGAPEPRPNGLSAPNPSFVNQTHQSIQCSIVKYTH